MSKTQYNKMGEFINARGVKISWLAGMMNVDPSTIYKNIKLGEVPKPLYVFATCHLIKCDQGDLT